MEPRKSGEPQRAETGDELLEEQNLLRGRKGRKQARHEGMEVGELNIVPYLDIVTNLVMFLLQASVTAVSLGEITTKLPQTGEGGGPTPPPEGEKPLTLTVVIGERGFTIAGAEGVLGGTAGEAAGPTLPKIGNNEYDYVGLTRMMVSVKKAYPKETKAFIVPEDQTTYQAIVATMDAMRENGPDVLFPDVMFAGF